MVASRAKAEMGLPNWLDLPAFRRIYEVMSEQERERPADPLATPEATSAKPLTPAAQRALAEAAARRAARDAQPHDQPKELRGRGGLDPVRYGDWEKDGLASDF